MTSVLPAPSRSSDFDGEPFGAGPVVPLTRFVGREIELAGLADQVGLSRLVTLVGPGGSGKTRLALAVADRLRHTQPHGVSWVELAELDEPAVLGETVAATLGTPVPPGTPPTRALVRHLQARPTLLVLDNCEHLVDGCASLVGLLLRACPHLRVLATSREPLGVTGETTWTVGGLGSREAVNLFVDRAKLVDPGFALDAGSAETVARLCRRLDGMPLALELAAARLRVLSLDQIVDRLDDAFSVLVSPARDAVPRHQTLRATLDWGHELLPEPERRLFAELSVFRGGFTLEAVEAVAGGGDVLGRLTRLVEKSLVQPHGDGPDQRYRLLDVVRQYADLRLGADRLDAGRRHAAHYLALAEDADRRSAGAQGPWLDRLAREQDNVRAALGWARQHDPPLGVRLAGAMGWYWRLRGSYAEGREWLQWAASTMDIPVPGVLIGLGMLEYLQCEYDRASTRLRQALDLFDPAAEPRVVARASQVLGSIAREQGRYADARARHEESLAIWRRLDDGVGITRSVKALGFTAWLEEDYPRARQLSTEALRRYREAGDHAGAVGALLDLGAATLREGDHARAESLLRECLTLSGQLGSREGTAWSTEQLGLLAAARADHAEAVRLLAASLAVHHELGDRCRTAGALEALAGEFVATGPRLAARLLAAAEEARAAIGSPRPPCDRAAHERRRRALESALPPPELAAATADGASMSLGQAVAAAIAAAEDFARVPLPAPGPITGPITGPVTVAEPELVVHALGRARVELGGRPLGTEDWTYAKPRELLYFLLTRPGGTKAEIGLALWPEASAKELRNSLHTGMKHLRRALGARQWVRFADGGYAIDRSLPFAYDVDGFEAAARAALGGEPDETALRAAADRYGGDFLTDLAVGDWADARRDLLRQRYEDVLLTLGRLLGQGRRYGEAAEVFTRLVEHDPFLEAAHRGLMRCHVAMGNPARAVRQYQELAALLGAEIGTGPAPETAALYARLQRPPA